MATTKLAGVGEGNDNVKRARGGEKGVHRERGMVSPVGRLAAAG